MFSFRGSLLSTTVILVCQSSATSSESIVRLPVRTQNNFFVFPSNWKAIYMSWYVLIILGAAPSSTCDVVSKMTSSSPSLSIETICCLTNRKSSISLWDTYIHHPSLSRELAFPHNLPNIISSETQLCLSLLG